MTNQKREYRRCGGCRWCWEFKNHPYVRWTCREHFKVNPGWFGCSEWISTKQIALNLLRTSQKQRKEG